MIDIYTINNEQLSSDICEQKIVQKQGLDVKHKLIEFLTFLIITFIEN